MNDGRTYPLSKTEEQWRHELSAAEYDVLRRAGTEPPGVGEYTDTKTQGVYSCRACATEQLRTARAARVDALGLGIGVLADPRRLGAGPAKHVILSGAELVTPLFFGLAQGIGAAVIHRGPPTQG